MLTIFNEGFDHFITLFIDSDVSHVIEDENQPDPDNLQFHELGDIIFNADISDQDIIEATTLNINSSLGDKCIPKQIVLGIDLLLPFLRNSFNRLFRDGEFPTQWATFIIPIFKKGDRENPSNYRGIALIDVLSKLSIYQVLTKIVRISDRLQSRI